ncbi:plasmid replication protein RepC [Agrobacterium tumefaciens]|uniref:plasmid replication protein RepC n=1 Tax=Agrobacterium tumefaciens TaxID=358 RepID=UPI002243CF42|nr:plasmid replication protein RepC [Agrobacterium tumefaciens]MCW8060570.1 replication initiation protein RepC [Agrobacterium tumefaciens]MCW8146013.1 replication initiation protein RepC [Agrobacterium tumefaciens]
MSTTTAYVPTGWARPVAGARKVTPGSLIAQRAARHYAGDRSTPIKRIEALQLAKRAAAAMGLKAAKIAMIDKLFGYSPSGDWGSKVANPIVWPSNEALARQLGLSVSTARHHLRGLAEAGLIAHSSHPTFQRRGVRDKNGYIVEAYGIDLSPIIVRYDELLAIAEAYEQEGRDRRALSLQRTQLRREIEGILEAARRDRIVGTRWQQYQARLDRLRETRVRSIAEYRETIAAYTRLLSEVEDGYEGAHSRSDLDTTVSGIRSLQATADISSDKCRHEASYGGSNALPCPSANASERMRTASRPLAWSEQAQDLHFRSDTGHVSLGLVRSACPALEDQIPRIFDSWTVLRASGYRLCAAAQINAQVWTEAEAYLGLDTAIAALAVTIQRAADGHVVNPGAYLRTLIQRGRRGELRISRSLFALATEKVSDSARPPFRSKATYRGFPAEPIAWSAWADLVREHAARPTPDLELVADAFRSWCRKGNIDLAQPAIEKAFIGFCKKWRTR